MRIVKEKDVKLDYVANLLKKGSVLVFPTDTVYIPLADATNEKAVKKVFLIKKRSLKKPIPIFVKDIKMAKGLAKINKEQEEFLKTAWPGRVTVVLERKRSRIKLYGVDKETIALRVPNYKLINSLFKKINRPLVGTSANISGQPSSGVVEVILRQFKNKEHQPDLAIDGGALDGKPSTVFDLIKWPPKILRN